MVALKYMPDACFNSISVKHETVQLHKLSTRLAEHHDAILWLQRDLDNLQLTDVLVGSLQTHRAGLNDMQFLTPALPDTWKAFLKIERCKQVS